ncbi:hypothetical protein [Nitrosomonas sp. Nm34]
MPLPHVCSDTHLLIRTALFGLKRIYRQGYAYKRAELHASGFAAVSHQ